MTHRIFQLFAAFILVALLPVQTAVANPDNDPLANFLQQRQNQNNAPAEVEPDYEGLDVLIREKTATAAQINAAQAKAQTQAAKPAAAPAAKASGRSDADDIIASAMGFLGVAYRFGGASPTGFDCSGFMQYIFRKTYAINLPRTSAEQATVGTPVSRSELQPGDMVFFRTAGSRISHVGMYVGNNRFIHAPRTGKRIEITSLSNKYWNSKYATARRVKRNNAQNFIRK